ncbi:ClC family H(+)/Cl(-) exchange transporter [Streptococcus iniae]|uniref:ClC family H(+)/Cl(-) exchange transporter n=1 Tax=Streptococcus iniae TaxID=1346 RepID=A0A3L8GGQ5_STRIN|nr:ClC family H(+)/Cl(-) exchange transporter [Streptococcus iniae]AGM98887.1 hypothetical protein K710_1115 [Streptococcus iniae SF1]AHY15845.1 ribonuclease HII [Streptococcus iniae]AHY17713.1 ribonuclease HII [Streptococcus iniae]AJG26005.1 ribonuclease HII [Streptococcus iniae]APD31882.1 ClC family H(+)/Cl(-) exchange transporter [Streptococcus iniae]
MENQRKEYHFSRNSITAYVWRGILVGIVAGVVVSLFRLLIELFSEAITHYYNLSHSNPLILIGIALLSLSSLLLVGLLIKSEPDIKGSGIPHVEGELKGLLSPNWWGVLWKKFLAGLLSISMGFLLGREGPSIQLGAMSAKGIAKGLNSSALERRVLIASGAAAGLSAAFNAPIAGLLFVVEEIYHHFSRLVWITALVASLVANFISLNIFGLKPILQMPKAVPFLPLGQYGLLIVLGIVLGFLGFIYEWVLLSLKTVFKVLGQMTGLPSHFHSLLVLPFILLLGYYSPNLLGGGHHLILSLSTSQTSLYIVLLFLLVRFMVSMLSYGSGLPGGIFLPILTLGSLSGYLFGLSLTSLGFMSDKFLPLFIILGMAGYFSAVSKAPLTAMILVTEMVGDLKPLMPIAVVTFMAYMIMDLLGGQPIYEAILEKMALTSPKELIQPTLMELTVSDKIAGKRVCDLDLPRHVLITTQINHKHSEVVTGETKLIAGATLFLVANEQDLGSVRQELMASEIS